MSLSKVREEINIIDNEMQTLFNQRMDCSNEVAAVKIAMQDKVFKPLREKEIVERFSEDKDYVSFVKKVMQISRKRQYGIFIEQQITSACDEEFAKCKKSITEEGVLKLKLKADKTSTDGLNVNDILSLIGDTSLDINNLIVSEDGYIDVTINVNNDKARQEALVLAYMLSEETIEYNA